MSLGYLVHDRQGGGTGPGLLVLHGWGANERDLLGLAPALDSRLTVISPRAPLTIGPGSFGWYQIQPGFAPVAASFQSAIDSVGELIVALPDAHGIDPDRLFVLGFSQGAVMTAALTFADASRFRGSVLLSGAPPSLGAADIPGHPCFVAHGSEDQVITIDRGNDLATLLKAHGADVEQHTYPYAHEISMETVRDLNAWFDRLI